MRNIKAIKFQTCCITYLPIRLMKKSINTQSSKTFVVFMNIYISFFCFHFFCNTSIMARKAPHCNQRRNDCEQTMRHCSFVIASPPTHCFIPLLIILRLSRCLLAANELYHQKTMRLAVIFYRWIMILFSL